MREGTYGRRFASAAWAGERKDALCERGLLQRTLYLHVGAANASESQARTSATLRLCTGSSSGVAVRRSAAVPTAAGAGRGVAPGARPMGSRLPTPCARGSLRGSPAAGRRGMKQHLKFSHVGFSTCPSFLSLSDPCNEDGGAVNALPGDTEVRGVCANVAPTSMRAGPPSWSCAGSRRSLGCSLPRSSSLRPTRSTWRSARRPPSTQRTALRARGIRRLRA